MKNKFAIIVVFAAVILTGNNMLFAQSEDDFEIEQLADNTLKITGYKGSEKDLTIPAELWGLKVTIIGRSAFRTKRLTGVVIPDTVIEIEDGAFKSNPLAKLELGKGLVKVGAEAFFMEQSSDRGKIGHLVLPDNLVEVGASAFRQCGVTTITWGKKIAVLGGSAFSWNDLTELTIPGTIKTIPGYCFAGNQITNLTIENGVTLIAKDAFNGYTGRYDKGEIKNHIATLVIPASLAPIDRNTFGDAVPRINEEFGNELTRVTLPANMDERNMKGSTGLGTAWYFPEALFNFWISQKKAGGTYIKRGPIWSKE
jgi:hypothetical protein